MILIADYLSPLINERPKPWISKVRELQFITENWVCLNKLLELNWHDCSCRLYVFITRELFIFPAKPTWFSYAFMLRGRIQNEKYVSKEQQDQKLGELFFVGRSTNTWALYNQHEENNMRAWTWLTRHTIVTP